MEEQSKRFKLNSKDTASVIANTTLVSGSWVAAATVADMFAQDGLERIETEKGLIFFLGQLICFILIKMAAKALRDPDRKDIRDWLTKVLGWIWGRLTGKRKDEPQDEEPSPRKKERPVKRLIDRLFNK